jgi:aminopeptidase
MEEVSRKFPPFDLTQLLRTVFDPKKGERIGILIDLDHPEEVVDFAFLKRAGNAVQKRAYEIFYRALQDGVMQQLGLAACDLFAYQKTGGSNLELPASATSPEGRNVSFQKEIYPHYQILLCIGDYSATAPLTATSKKFGFRGGTLHGMNETIVRTGLSVDYNEVSRSTGWP